MRSDDYRPDDYGEDERLLEALGAALAVGHAEPSADELFELRWAVASQAG